MPDKEANEEAAILEILSSLFIGLLGALRFQRRL